MDLSASENIVSELVAHPALLPARCAEGLSILSWTWVCESGLLLLSPALAQWLFPHKIQQLSDFYALLQPASVTELQTALAALTGIQSDLDLQALPELEIPLNFADLSLGGCNCRLLPLCQQGRCVMIQAQLLPAAVVSALPPVADPVRDDFFNQLAHDVRNALSSVGGFSQLLRRRKLVHGEAESLVERMQQAAENAHQLLQEMLFAREIERSRMQTDSLETLIQESLRWFSMQTREKELTFVSEVAEDLPAPAIPTAWFERLLKQLLANALKFTPSGGEIRLMIEAAGGLVRIKVTDTGPGIPAELQSRLFEKVMLRERRAGGMELYLAWQIVQHYGGRIWFETAEGMGSTFYIELPVS